jgi:hypothetical protein
MIAPNRRGGEAQAVADTGSPQSSGGRQAGTTRGGADTTPRVTPAGYEPFCWAAGCDARVYRVPYCPFHAAVARVSADADEMAQREQEWNEW